MDNRKADVATFSTDTDNHIVKAWLSHDRAQKVYRLTVVPVEVKTYSDGVVMHTVVAYSGVAINVEPCARYSRSKLDKLAQDPKVLEAARRHCFRLGGIIES